jgi:hypothetical protein
MFSPAEQEVIVLNAAWGMIDDMVNHAVFVPLGDKVHDTNLIPQTTETLRLFNILLADFLSPLVRRGRGDLPFALPAPTKGARSSDLTFLFYLRQVAASPRLYSDAAALGGPVEAFSVWLEVKSFVEKVWLPSIEVEVDLAIERREWIKICGDIAKHSFARRESNVAKIARILAEHGHKIDEGVGYVLLPEFWDWFHANLFAYHASTIAEFLNNIRWGLYTYLCPEFERAFHRVDPEPMYRFHVPAEIAHPLARSMYWDLMNRCRSTPYFPHFTVTQSLKCCY